MERKEVKLNEAYLEVFFMSSSEERSTGYDSPSYPEEKSIYFVERDGLDILDSLTEDEVLTIEEQL